MKNLVLGIILAGMTGAHAQQPTEPAITTDNVLELVDANGNGKITCAEAKAAGLSTPINSDHPAYPYMRDGDGDGMVCE